MKDKEKVSSRILHADFPLNSTLDIVIKTGTDATQYSCASKKFGLSMIQDEL
jgi:hypothetical protein